MNLLYANGTQSQFYELPINEVLKTNENGRHTFDYTIPEVDADVVVIYFRVYATGQGIYEKLGSPSTEKWTYNYGFFNPNVIFDEIDKKVGLLNGIIGWLQSIKDGITSLFDSIAGLPAKLWSAISDGLKALFVPSTEFMANQSDKWDSLLNSRFGAVYQVANIIYESWENISLSDETNTIELPEVSIPLPNGNSFTFGGYSVQIVPQGFGFITSVLKSIIAILVTLMFMNGLYHRYDEVMGVQS